MKYSPIVLFVYDRLKHTIQTIQALKKNKLAAYSRLYIFSDAAKNVKAAKNVHQVRKYIRGIKGFHNVTIFEREKNLGLANSIIDGVSKIINKHGKVIVLEDDLITSPYFLKFMNEALNVYQDNEKIYSITGFNFSTEFMNFPDDFIDDVYLNIRPMSWSWASWKSKWNGIDWNIKDYERFKKSKKLRFDFNRGGTDLTNMLNAQVNGEIDSWYIRWTYNAFLKNKYTIYPKKSFVNNIGHDNTGVHCGIENGNILSHTELNFSSQISFNRNPMLNSEIVSNFNKAFNLPLKTKLILSIKAMLNHVKSL
jgi:hypothetical protein